MTGYMKQPVTEDRFRAAVKDSISIRQSLDKLGLTAAGGNYLTFRKYASRWNVDITHLDNSKPSLHTYLVKNRVVHTHRIKNKLLKQGLLRPVCNSCGLSEWLGKQIPLELHHVNGDRLDNRMENMVLLCPNCHAQTETYRGKNAKKSP